MQEDVNQIRYWSIHTVSYLPCLLAIYNPKSRLRFLTCAFYCWFTSCRKKIRDVDLMTCVSNSKSCIQVFQTNNFMQTRKNTTKWLSIKLLKKRMSTEYFASVCKQFNELISFNWIRMRFCSFVCQYWRLSINGM